ncbi:MAG: ATP-dependent DNA helicase RecG [bacterium]
MNYSLLLNVLKKECQNNYSNTSVFGGVSNFVKNILKNQNLPPVVVELLNYDKLDKQIRKKVVEKVIYELEKNSTLSLPDQSLSNQSANSIDSKYLEKLILDKDILNKVVEQTNFNNSDFLNTPLSSLVKDLGINKRILNTLKKQDITTLKDLIWFLPRSYSDRTIPLQINQALNYEKAYLLVQVISEPERIDSTKKNLSIIKYIVTDKAGNKAEILFFNQDYILHLIKKNNRIKVYGRVYKNKFYQIVPEEWDYEHNHSLDFDRIVPHYSTSIKPKKIRQIIYRALKISYKHIVDPLFDILKNVDSGFNFVQLSKAIVNIHFPSSFEVLEYSRNRLALEEIIYTQILLAGMSRKNSAMYVIDKQKACKAIQEIDLPFRLTEAQQRTIEQIIDDMSSGNVCRRLVQGDVGAGKTIVCILCCYAVVAHSYQACVMAPTEILAYQHYLNFSKILPKARIEMLTSKVRGKKREKILQDLKQGNIDILIGTHALIEDRVEFKNLAFVVIDEQHKFGVLQRLKLYSKSEVPHLIVMSATPIPRTLAFTVYGDLDISVIDQLPEGRKRAITEIFSYKEIGRVYSIVEEQLKQGRQAYFVCPSIFDNPKLELKNVLEVFEEVKKRFSLYNVTYLHGKMSSKQKEETMNQFREGKYHILVSTTVIEVGVDVPNANVIVILDSERFGLSQLHQLRGRVKRSHFEPYCLLVTSKNISYVEFSKSLQRMSVLKFYDDGFKIAEKDLELRGPGEVFGYKQHGFTEFKALNPIKDINLIKFSNDLAKAIYPYVFELDFIKAKIKQINHMVENLSQTI